LEGDALQEEIDRIKSEQQIQSNTGLPEIKLPGADSGNGMNEILNLISQLPESARDAAIDALRELRGQGEE
jgi:hypothetical protein